MHITLFALLPALLPEGAIHMCRSSRGSVLAGAGGQSATVSNAMAQVRMPASIVMDASSQTCDSRPWLRRIRNAGTTVAAAALIALPRGPARAVETSAAPPVTTVDGAKLAAPARGSNTIDMDKLAGRKLSQRYSSKQFLFSDELTGKSPLREELDELERAKTEKKFEKAATTLITYGLAGGAVYVSVKGALSIEKWMKDQEMKDIEAERELTGQYISVDAGDIDSVIDPSTGKNLTIAGAGKKKKADSAAAAEPAEPKQVPWLLRVLGLGGIEEADDDSFWEKGGPDANVPRYVDDDGLSSSTTTGNDNGGAPSDGDGGDGGDASGGGGGGDGLEDDSSELDDLGDLLG